jgi:hypothetical protein
MATVEPIKGGGAVQVVVLYGVDCRRICSAHGRGAIVVQVKDPAALTPAELAAVKAAEAPADALALADARMIAARFAGENPGVPTAVTTAAGLGAVWIITPELCICGYAFTDQIGTDWILSQPDPWMIDFCRLVAQLRVTVFLSHPERDRQTAKLHNSVFVIAANCAILGRHRKINTLRVGAEAWSSPGGQAARRLTR